MIQFSNRDYPKKELLKRVGRIEQLAGIRRVRLAEGRGEGIEMAEVYTGSGFAFEVILSRGMDIGRASYRGIPLSFQASPGLVHPSYYDPRKFGWLRSFTGGLLVTCGLTHAGVPATEGNEEIGLHGRISHIPAEIISLQREWKDEKLYLGVTGEVRESRMFGENIVLRRKIGSRAGENRLFIADSVRNESFQKTPHIILYHVNIGFPLIDNGSYLEANVKECTPRDEEAEKDRENFDKFSSPVPGFREKCYFLDIEENSQGKAEVSIVNPGLKLKVYLIYPKKVLPYFVEWKMMGEGNYVVGIEPSNTLLLPREELKKKGLLPYLAPGEEINYELEIGVEEIPA